MPAAPLLSAAEVLMASVPDTRLPSAGLAMLSDGAVLSTGTLLATLTLTALDAVLLPPRHKPRPPEC